MRRLKTIIIVSVLFSGCASYSTFDASNKYEEYRNSPEFLSVVKQSPKGSIKLHLMIPESCGCYLEKTNSKKEIVEDVTYQCIGFPIKGDEPGKEIKQKLKKDGVKASSFYVFESFNDIAKLSLEQQLSAYFVDVEVVTQNIDQVSAESSSIVSYYPAWGVGNPRYIYVKLIAKLADGKLIEGTSNIKCKLKNTGWYIPVAIITFPVGYVIGTIVLFNKHDAMVNKMFAHSINTAAADLSKKLAAEFALNPNQGFNVYVMLE